jgi:hypothetical protein
MVGHDLMCVAPPHDRIAQSARGEHGAISPCHSSQYPVPSRLNLHTDTPGHRATRLRPTRLFRHAMASLWFV